MDRLIPGSIKPHLEEIAERLSANHASIMIGAGFSKNAQRGEATSNPSPSWHELGDCFYRKIHGKSPVDSDKCYQDVLKLAEEVESIYGRNVLDTLLKSEIPDKDLQPSDIHQELLKLPWTDVFTTNYDTLLERAAETVWERRYETVTHAQDLVWSQQPRIIKLHGSFPSDRPFVITEEDYRKYPKDFAPFVNTVQQSLLENTLCLVGFSGDDPNFAKWIGWIRDNLGKDNSPKIYLIGVLSLSMGQTKLLEQRNIIPVDLSPWYDDQKEALKNFVGFLSTETRKDESKLDWPNTPPKNVFDSRKELKPQFESIVTAWQRERECYPNWLILPRDRRKALREATTEEPLYYIDKIPAHLALKFLFEFNWRRERCLLPIYNGWIPSYESILNENETCETPLEERMELKLSLLRFYREEGITEKWESLSDELGGRQLSAQQLAKLHYERCLFSLFKFDKTALLERLDLWPHNSSLPYWEAKRAMLMAELGNTSEAERILEISLQDVRAQLNVQPAINDFLLPSQEAYLLLLLMDVHRSTFSVSEKEHAAYADRWNKWKPYKCDPIGEFQIFEARLTQGSFAQNPKQISYGFEIGTYSTSVKVNPVNEAALEAYSYLRYLEETALPLRLRGMNFDVALAIRASENILNHSPAWARSVMIRLGQVKMAEGVFDRKSLARMSCEYADSLAKDYLNTFKKALSDKADYWAPVLAKFLSRLSFKCNYETRLAIFDAAKEGYVNYRDCPILLGKIIEAFTAKEQGNIILPKIIELPIITNHCDEDIFTHLTINECNRIPIKAHIVSRLLAETLDNKTRKAAITRLMVLYKNGLLNKQQTNCFAKNTWKFVDKNGFPKETNYYYSAWINAPHPANIHPESLFRAYLNTAPFPAKSKQNDGFINVPERNPPLLVNIANVGKSNYAWSKEEINSLIVKLKNWWDGDKKFLLDARLRFGFSMADELKLQFKHMAEIFQYVVSKNIVLIDSENMTRIKEIIDDFQQYHLPNLRLRASMLSIFLEDERELKSNIIKEMYSKNEELLDDAIAACLILNENGYNVVDELNAMVNQILCRTEVALSSFLCGVNIIFNSDVFSDSVLSRLSTGLSALLSENQIVEDDSSKSVFDKLLVRKAMAQLVPHLNAFFASREQEPPTYLTLWREQLSSGEEFVDIRNLLLENETVYISRLADV